MKYSLTQGGILLAILGAVIATLGFSESCTTEITAKLLPLVGGLPGLIAAWIGRHRQGDVTLAGFKK